MLTVCAFLMKLASSAGATASNKGEGHGPVRVRFTRTWLGTLKDNLSSEDYTEVRKLCDQLADILFQMESAGVTPVLPDGKVGGNAAVLYKGMLVVSKSGKLPGKRPNVDTDFCVVTDFGVYDWSCKYYSSNPAVLPTCDTPLHYCGLKFLNGQDLSGSLPLTKTEGPSTNSQHLQNGEASIENEDLIGATTACLHGHALATEEEAAACGFPCSTDETMASTPEDTAALIQIIREYPYPKDKVYIRKNHGFLLYGDDLPNAIAHFEENLVPKIAK